MDNLMWEMGGGPETSDIALQMGWEDLIDLRVAVGRAEALGIRLTDDDMEEVDELIQLYRENFIIPEQNFNRIQGMGFSDASFRRFVETLILRERVFDHVAAGVVIDEEEFDLALEQFIEENLFDLKHVFVYFIEVETETQANDILMQVLQGADFTELMRQYSVSYFEDMLFEDEDGQLIETVMARETAMSFEQILGAYDMEEGVVSQVLALENGNYGLYQIAEIDEVEHSDIVEFFRESFESEARQDLFRNELVIWRNQADIVPNNRHFN